MNRRTFFKLISHSFLALTLGVSKVATSKLRNEETGNGLHTPPIPKENIEEKLARFVVDIPPDIQQFNIENSPLSLDEYWQVVVNQTPFDIDELRDTIRRDVYGRW